MEVDLEKVLSEAINLNMECWKHLQTVDYEQIPFKCKVCHKYGHFAKSCKKKTHAEEGEITREEWNEASQRKGNKAINIQANSSEKNKKASENSFQALASASEPQDQMENIVLEKEETPQENKRNEPVLEEIGKTYEPLLPTQSYVETRPETSQNLGLVSRSRAKAQTEETLERREEEYEQQTRKGRKPNKYHIEQETAREKAADK